VRFAFCGTFLTYTHERLQRYCGRKGNTPGFFHSDLPGLLHIDSRLRHSPAVNTLPCIFNPWSLLCLAYGRRRQSSRSPMFPHSRCDSISTIVPNSVPSRFPFTFSLNVLSNDDPPCSVLVSDSSHGGTACQLHLSADSCQLEKSN
jgi:hypothetical protein